MFVQWDASQATDQCATMHVKGWLFCWLSRHNCSVEFTQRLQESLRQTDIYQTIRRSDNVRLGCLYTTGDRKATVILGCDPRSSEGLCAFKRALQWAKVNELSLEIAPNRGDYDEETRQLLTGIGLSTAHRLPLEEVASNSFATSGGDFSDLRLVMAISRAVQERFKDSPPEMVAALMLAITDKDRNDLVERPGGIYLSKECCGRLSSFDVWLCADGTIVITRRRVMAEPDEPKAESQRFLNERLPGARKLGGINPLHYALGLCQTFSLNADRLVIQSEGRVAVLPTRSFWSRLLGILHLSA